MKPKFTPGPWSQDPEGELAVSIEGADGSVVCDVHGASDDPRCEANCNLIEAAPTMFAALVEAERALSAYCPMPELSQALAKVRAAIGAAS